MTTTWHTAPDPELDAEGLRTVAELSQRQDFLAAIRTLGGITQTELAARLGITQPTISATETAPFAGRSLDTFIRYAQAIGVGLELAATSNTGERITLQLTDITGIRQPSTGTDPLQSKRPRRASA